MGGTRHRPFEICSDLSSCPEGYSLKLGLLDPHSSQLAPRICNILQEFDMCMCACHGTPQTCLVVCTG